MSTSSPVPLDVSEVYVFCHLPGATTPTVTGRHRIKRTERGPAGTFQYGARYLARPDTVALDPWGLALQASPHAPTARLGGLYGVLRDASPDAWGRRVLEASMGVREELPELVYLLAAGDDRAGALSFGVDRSAPRAAPTTHGLVRLTELAAAAALLETQSRHVLAPEYQQAGRLLMPGASMGGARPKAVIEDANALWIAKFPAREDRFNVAGVEAGLLTLAAQAGLTVPRHRIESVGGRPVLLVQRFDRTWTPSGYERARYLSALTVLDADELRSLAWSYVQFAEELRRRSSHARVDQVELFDRMVFNALVSNDDDHPRNHALIAETAEGWRLSPLFDVVPRPRPESFERDLAMVAGRYGRSARRANLISEAGVFGLGGEEANTRVDRLKQIVVGEWEASMIQHGVSLTDRDAIRSAMAPGAFEGPVPAPVT